MHECFLQVIHATKMKMMDRAPMQRNFSYIKLYQPPLDINICTGCSSSQKNNKKKTKIVASITTYLSTDNTR